jgi:ferredoxin
LADAPVTPIYVNFLLKDGTTKRVAGKEGMSILDVAHAYGVDLEGECNLFYCYDDVFTAYLF